MAQGSLWWVQVHSLAAVRCWIARGGPTCTASWFAGSVLGRVWQGMDGQPALEDAQVPRCRSHAAAQSRNGCTLLAASGLLAAPHTSFALPPMCQVVSGRRHVGLVDVQPVGSYAVR